MTRRPALIAAAAALAVAAAAPAAAHAYPKPRALDQRTFDVDVRLVQRTTWSVETQSTSLCDPASKGSGSETIVMRSRPHKMTFKRYGTSYVVLGRLGPTTDGVLGLHGTVARAGKLSVGSVGSECGDNGGPDDYDGAAPPQPDCGTRAADLHLVVGWVNEPRAGLTLRNSPIFPLGDLFERCPLQGGVEFPDVLDEQQQGGDVVARLSPAELFDRGTGQWVVVGRGSRRTDRGGAHATTTVRFDVRLTDRRR